MAWKTSKLRLCLLRLSRRLARWIWLRRFRCLTRLTERQLKNLWQQEKMLVNLEESKYPTTGLIKRLETTKAESPLLLSLEADRTSMTALEDLQLASMQLTSILENRSS